MSSPGFCRSGSETEEYKTFTSHFSDISDAIQNPVAFAGELLQESLINESIYRDACGRGLPHSEKVSCLMMSVQSQIKRNADKLNSFIKLLEKDATMSGLCALLKTDCTKDFSKLLTKFNIQCSDLQRECNDGLFNDIIEDIESYAAMAKSLRISEAKYKTIHDSKEDENGKSLAVLKAWKRKHGSDGTYLMLVEAFLAMDDRTVAERIIKYVKRLPPEEVVVEEDQDIEIESKEDPLKDFILDQSHHSDVMGDIQELAPDFVRLATAFRLSTSTIRSIEYQHRNSPPWNALNEVVTEWLKWNCNREKGNPNRRWLVNAVKSVNKELGLRLQAKYSVSKQS